MVPLFFYYYRQIHQINLPFSLLMGIIGELVQQTFVFTFSLSLVTGGLLLSVYFNHLQNKEQYYFYYNKGITLRQLILSCFLVDLVLVALLQLASASLW